MLIYRAPLEGQAAEVLSVRVTPAPAGRRLGARGALYRVIVRYADLAGRVRTHRGRLTAEQTEGRTLDVAGYQWSRSEALITLRPRTIPPGGDGAASVDRIRVPIALQAWGVTVLNAATIRVHARCRGEGESLTIWGSLGLTLAAAGTSLRLCIPYARVSRAEGAGRLAWEAAAGVTGLHLKVGPGGRITGEAVIAVRCEGAQPRLQPPEKLPQPRLGSVREAVGRVSRVAAEPSGEGHAVLHGLLDLDLYWFDRAGQSRWTGRQAPFSALLPVDGLGPGDRLQAEAALERLTHRVEGDEVSVHGVLSVAVTALRPCEVALGAGRYRLEQIAGSGAATVELEERFLAAGDGDPHGGQGGARQAPAELPLAGPADGWQEVVAVLSTPEATAVPGSGQWRVRAALGGTPRGEGPYPAPLRASVGGSVPVGSRDLLAVVAGLESIGARGIGLRTHLRWGSSLPTPSSAAGGGVAEGMIPLPGPVRAVLGLEARRADDLRLKALVVTAAGDVLLLSGRVALPAQAAGGPVRATAVPVERNGAWQLACQIELASVGS